ncbi:hypothetical protein HDE_07578 [Halotydeus destructor]|nr:hypothetical protein HDE_07578 [Halotydeus destructor]
MKPVVLLLLVFISASASKYGEDVTYTDIKRAGDFISLSYYDEKHLKPAIDKHIPFEVDDKLYRGEKFKCYVEKRCYEIGKKITRNMKTIPWFRKIATSSLRAR